MRNSTSPQIRSGEPNKLSSVWLTEPSVEFSTGTTPKSASPASTSWNTSSTEDNASARTECPKCLSVAVWENVPSGPRYPTLSGSSWARQADMISRNSLQDFLGAQRTLVPLARHAQHLRLAFRAVEVHGVAVGVFGNPGLARQPRAVVEQLVDTGIHAVDLGAQLFERQACVDSSRRCLAPEPDFFLTLRHRRPSRRALECAQLYHPRGQHARDRPDLVHAPPCPRRHRYR